MHEAEEEYREAIRLSPNLAQAHNNLANIYVQTNKYFRAIKEYKKLLS